MWNPSWNILKSALALTKVYDWRQKTRKNDKKSIEIIKTLVWTKDQKHQINKILNIQPCNQNQSTYLEARLNKKGNTKFHRNNSNLN